MATRADLSVGDLVAARVTKVLPYGFLVESLAGVPGMVTGARAPNLAKTSGSRSRRSTSTTTGSAPTSSGSAHGCRPRPDAGRQPPCRRIDAHVKRALPSREWTGCSPACTAAAPSAAS